MEMNRKDGLLGSFIELMFSDMDTNRCFDFWDDGDIFVPYHEIVDKLGIMRKWR